MREAPTRHPPPSSEPAKTVDRWQVPRASPASGTGARPVSGRTRRNVPRRRRVRHRPFSPLPPADPERPSAPTSRASRSCPREDGSSGHFEVRILVSNGLDQQAASGSPGTIAGPESPPVVQPWRESRTSPPFCSVSPAWHSRQCSTRIGRISFSKNSIPPAPRRRRRAARPRRMTRPEPESIGESVGHREAGPPHQDEPRKLRDEGPVQQDCSGTGLRVTPGVQIPERRNPPLPSPCAGRFGSVLHCSRAWI